MARTTSAVGKARAIHDPERAVVADAAGEGVAAGVAVARIPEVPADRGGVVVLADVDVLVERNDRHIDVVVRRRGVLELGQQVLRRGLECVDLARLRHRAGIIEHKRDAQPVVAPLHR